MCDFQIILKLQETQIKFYTVEFFFVDLSFLIYFYKKSHKFKIYI